MLTQPANAFVLRRLLSHKVDVAICGGGVVGSTLAASLKRLNLKTMIVDAKPRVEVTASASKNMYFPRCLAINRLSYDLLNDLDIWSKLQKYRSPQAINAMKVWDFCSPSKGFMLTNSGEPIAHIVENDVLTKCLHDSISDLDCRFEHEIVDFEANEDFVEFDLRINGRIIPIASRLLVIAGGGNVDHLLTKASFKKCIDIDYKQSAITCVLKVDKSESQRNDLVYLRFLPTGPLAILPLSNTHSCMVWGSDENGFAEKLRQMNDEDFLAEINETLAGPHKTDTITEAIVSFFDKLPFFTSDQGHYPSINSFCEIQKGSRLSFPLKTILPETYVQPRIALLGDSAHRIHPLAGQGANLGFADVKSLTSILQEYLNVGGCDFGSMTVLKEYERQRQCVATSKALLMDGIKRLFGTDLLPIIWGRTAGSEVFKRFETLKSKVVHVASFG